MTSALGCMSTTLRLLVDVKTKVISVSSTSALARLGEPLDVEVRFADDGTFMAQPDSTVGRLSIKPAASFSGPPFALDTTWDEDGTGTAKVYKFSFPSLDSSGLRTALANDRTLPGVLQVSWLTPEAETADLGYSKSNILDIILMNSSDRLDDEAPDPLANASWEWLKLRLPEAGGFEHDDDAKSIDVASATPSAHAASHAAAGSDPLTLSQSQVTDLTADLDAKVPTTRTINGQALSGNVTLVKADLGLGNVDNTTDAGKPISSATQAALDAKAPLASPTFTGTVTLPAAQISSANLRNSTAYSVIGRSSNSNGVPADIVAGNNGVLCRNGSGALGFSVPSLSGGNVQGILPLSRGGLGESITDPASTQMLKAVGVLVVTVYEAAQDVTISGWVGDLSTCYFDLSTVSTTYRFWFNTGSNSAPGDGGHTLVEVATIDPPNDFAAALNALASGLAFSSYFNGTDVSITWVAPGAVTAPEMTNASPLSVTVNTTGADEVLDLNPEIIARLP